MERTYILGDCDYNGRPDCYRGRNNCTATFTYRLEDGRFSMQARIWKPRKNDIFCGGQVIEEVLSYFPHDAKAARMAAVWREWHCNDMRAGSPAQRAWLKASEASRGDREHYNWATTALAEAGLNPDPNHLHHGKPYRYGHAWLREELPSEIIAEIESW